MDNTQVLLKRRPSGAPVAEDFEVVTTAVPTLQSGEALIENHYVSLDAGFRNWMDEDAGDDVLPAMALGAPVMGLTVGRVLESKHDTLREGQLVMGRLAWEAYSIAKDDFLIELEESDVPLHYHLGILGDTGMSAYYGGHRASLLMENGVITARHGKTQQQVPNQAEGIIPYFSSLVALLPENRRLAAHLEALQTKTTPAEIESLSTTDPMGQASESGR